MIRPLLLFLLATSCITSGKITINNSTEDSSSNLYLKGIGSIGILFCHGSGAHPDWKVVGYLRRSLNKGELKAHTLSLQMPTASGKWTNYRDTFPVAIKTIYQGIKKLKGYGADEIILVGHSMGARMASYFLAHEKEHDVSLFVGLGMRNNGGNGLNVITNMREINIPVLDIYGTSKKNPDYRDGQQRKKLNFTNVKQAVVEGANHKFDRNGAALDKIISSWIDL